MFFNKSKTQELEARIKQLEEENLNLSDTLDQLTAEANAVRSMLGSASFIILDEDVDIVWATRKMTYFFKHESCGKCSPCREGTFWLNGVYNKLSEGRGTKQDIDLLETIIGQMEGNCFCLLGEFAVPGVRTSLDLFRAEYEAVAVAEEDAAPPQQNLINTFF